MADPPTAYGSLVRRDNIRGVTRHMNGGQYGQYTVKGMGPFLRTERPRVRLCSGRCGNGLRNCRARRYEEGWAQAVQLGRLVAIVATPPKMTERELFEAVDSLKFTNEAFALSKSLFFLSAFRLELQLVFGRGPT
jgi:hypothetical protein